MAGEILRRPRDECPHRALGVPHAARPARDEERAKAGSRPRLEGEELADQVGLDPSETERVRSQAATDRAAQSRSIAGATGRPSARSIAASSGRPTPSTIVAKAITTSAWRLPIGCATPSGCWRAAPSDPGQ